MARYSVLPIPASELAATQPEAADPPPNRKSSLRRMLVTALIWLFGVLLPAFTLVHELWLGWCAEALFDPLPSLGHVVLVGWVPIANVWALLALRPTPPRGELVQRWRAFSQRWGLLRIGNGLALGVTTFYALLFLPLVPVSVMAVMLYGLGLLSLSPLLALFATLALGRRLRTAAAETAPVSAGGDRRVPLRRLGLAGFAVVMAVLFGAALPRTLTEWAVDRAANGSPAKRDRALALLRTAGDREVMLRLCYVRRGQMTDPLSFVFGLLDYVEQASPAQARQVFFRVTGDNFSSMPAPDLASLGGQRLSELDLDQGGSIVGGAVADVELVGSSIAASLDPDAALGYLEWTLEFHNTGEIQREARTVIALPPGGVVSRATLWIAGEEREAVFGGRGEVRQAYEQVVQAQRDPLLITTSGTDRVLVQCFPVPPAGRMKIRLGVTMPLAVTAEDRAELDLPFFAERNFGFANDLEHDLTVDADQPLAPARAGGPSVDLHAASATPPWTGALDDHALTSTHFVIRRSPTERAAWAADPADPTRLVVHQLERRKVRAPPIVVVLDGSRGLAPHVDTVREVLARHPETRVLFAGDTLAELSTAEVAALDADDFAGGRDNVAPLERAWEQATQLARQLGDPSAPPGRIVWVHGPQPVLLTATDLLAERCAAAASPDVMASDRPEIVALTVPEVETDPTDPTVSGSSIPNRVIDGMKDCRQMVVARPRGAFAEELQRLLTGAPVDRAEWVARRSRGVFEADTRDASRLAARTTSGHLVRLWQRDEVDRLTAVDRDEATKLAIAARLVTPLTGAVVLETIEQYTDAGLDPTVAGEIPTIPEPTTILLLLVGAGVLLASFVRQAR